MYADKNGILIDLAKRSQAKKYGWLTRGLVIGSFTTYSTLLLGFGPFMNRSDSGTAKNRFNK